MAIKEDDLICLVVTPFLVSGTSPPFKKLLKLFAIFMIIFAVPLEYFLEIDLFCVY